MDFPMYDNARKLVKQPHDAYLSHLQALINERWENSTQTIFTVYQQTDIGSTEWVEQPISIDTAIDIGTGFKRGDDFKVFSHKDISADLKLGLMYRTEEDYWICTNTNGYASPTNSCEVRRCNNVMKWVDTETGFVNQQWCAIDYELSSPRPSKDKDIVVADGHIFVLVQGNDLTRSIPKNQRFIFNGLAFKVSAFQSLLDEDNVTFHSNLLYIDMYADPIQPSDDVVNGIANATDYVYTVITEPNITEQEDGYVGELRATVMLNGETVERELEWTSNEYAVIDEENHTYRLVGEVGDVAVIRATLVGNPDVYDEFYVNIVTKSKILITDKNQNIITSFNVPLATNGNEAQYAIGINPLYTSVLDKQPATFTVYLYENGVQQDGDITWEYSGLTNEYFDMVQDGHVFTLSVKDISMTPLKLTFSCEDVTRTIDVLLKPFF